MSLNYCDYGYDYPHDSRQQPVAPRPSQKFFTVICWIILILTIINIGSTIYNSIVHQVADESIIIEDQYTMGITSYESKDNIFVYASSESMYPIRTQFWITGEYLEDSCFFGLFHKAGDKFTKLKTFNLKPGEMEIQHEHFTGKYIYTGGMILKEEHIYLNPVDMSWLVIVLAFAITLLNIQLTLEQAFEYPSDFLIFLTQEISLSIFYTLTVMWVMQFVTVAKLSFFIFNIRIF